MAATEHLESERKFDVEETYVLADLTTVDGVAAMGQNAEHHLDATYYDTPDLRLARAGVTLRRRTGGNDAGWHLKLPASGDARRELRQPLGRTAARPPKALLEPVAGLLRGVPVGRVATLRTRRIATTVSDGDGRILAEIADDRVTGTALAVDDGSPAIVTTWREVEVELVDGDERLLTSLGAAIVASGAHPSPSRSKLGRVLAGRLEQAGGWTRPEAPYDGGDGEAAPVGTAGEVVVAAVRGQLAALQRADVMVRRGEADGIHDVRVACRRLRSILAAHRSVLVREHTDPLRAELRWLGATLSAARDSEVSLAYLRDLVGAQPSELVLGPVVARLRQAELRGGVSARKQAMRTLADPRYFRLLDSLFDLVDRPPLTALAARPAAPVLTDVLRKTTKRLRRRVRAAENLEDPQAHGLALHEVRKAGKRLRYTAEVAAPVLGRRTSELVQAMEGIQDVLGIRQDTVVTREQCRQLGIGAFTAGENAWTYGRLHALEEARAAQAERDFWQQWPSLRRLLRRAVKRG